MNHECELCGVEAVWIDDGGPPDGWIFLDHCAEPLCAECLGTLGLGPNDREIARRVGRVRQNPGVISLEHMQVPSCDENVYEWLGFEPGVDPTGEPCWRWTRADDAFAALEPVRQALQESWNRRVFS